MIADNRCPFGEVEVVAVRGCKEVFSRRTGGSSHCIGFNPRDFLNKYHNTQQHHHQQQQQQQLQEQEEEEQQEDQKQEQLQQKENGDEDEMEKDEILKLL